MSDQNKFLWRIVDGSDALSSMQMKGIDAALAHFSWFRAYRESGVDVEVEVLSNLEVRNNRKDISSLKQIIDLLLGVGEETATGAYLLPCHLHQGFKGWHESMLELKEDYIQYSTREVR